MAQRPLNLRAARRVASAVTILALGGCLGQSTGPPTHPQLVMTLVDTTVAQGDTIFGTATATANFGLQELTVTALDAGDTTLVEDGTAFDAKQLQARFAYRVVRTAPGGYVRLRARVLNFKGDTAVVVDSAHVTS